MKITDLEKFSFRIGNLLEDEDVEVVATNAGITIDGDVDGKYDDNDIIDAHD